MAEIWYFDSGSRLNLTTHKAIASIQTVLTDWNNFMSKNEPMDLWFTLKLPQVINM